MSSIDDLTDQQVRSVLSAFMKDTGFEFVRGRNYDDPVCTLQQAIHRCRHENVKRKQAIILLSDKVDDYLDLIYSHKCDPSSYRDYDHKHNNPYHSVYNGDPEKVKIREADRKKFEDKYIRKS